MLLLFDGSPTSSREVVLVVVVTTDSVFFLLWVQLSLLLVFFCCSPLCYLSIVVVAGGVVNTTVAVVVFAFATNWFLCVWLLLFLFPCIGETMRTTNPTISDNNEWYSYGSHNTKKECPITQHGIVVAWWRLYWLPWMLFLFYYMEIMMGKETRPP